MEYVKVIGEKLGGRIKSYPEDFIVEEVHKDFICTVNYTLIDKIKTYFVKGKGDQLHFTLIKKNLNTFQAIEILAKKLRVSKKRFGVCGNKDKVAVTSQRVSVYNINPKELRKIKLRTIKIKDLKFENYRLNPGNLLGNRFTITIRDIPYSKSEIIKKLEHFKERVGMGIPNYFGPQRFGDKREVNHLVGEEVVKGNYERAVKILLTHLGKESEDATKARRFLRDNWGKFKEALKLYPKSLDIEIKVLNSLVSGKSYKEALDSLPPQIKNIFVHAYQSYLFNKKLTNLIKNGLVPKTIVVSPIKTKDLSFKGYERKTMIVPKDFEIVKVKDGLATIRFFLEKGSYATVVLNELLN